MCIKVTHISNLWRISPVDNNSCSLPYARNLSYNNLSGTIPAVQNFSRFPPSSYYGNPELCGSPNSICGGQLNSRAISGSNGTCLSIGRG
jgi:hypothetical protein